MLCAPPALASRNPPSTPRLRLCHRHRACPSSPTEMWAGVSFDIDKWQDDCCHRALRTHPLLRVLA
ncbi:hypothetical protein BDQ12DRAFT_691228 [Crucibulum laeve]|uniref:Uncharacterized protein n=1 Tax=Crucibulum laeve TaxID=68775 RepID=A0A5C3LKZ1_9AGAR|nr:hypothetical protein BDQ12DRAFT_691228 [Crucibulum laeve]